MANVHSAVVLDVDLGAGRFQNPLDGLSARADQEADLLWAAIAALPRRQRQVLVLRYYLDQTESEIANTLGVSAGSVKKHASRGIAALAREWGAR